MNYKTIYRIYNLMMSELSDIKERAIELQKERNLFEYKSSQYNAVDYSVAHFMREAEQLENDIEQYRQAHDIEKSMPLPIE